MTSVKQWSKLSSEERSRILKRPAQESTVQMRNQVTEVIQDVKTRGDEALWDFSKKWDSVGKEVLKKFHVSTQELESAFQKVTLEERNAIERAKRQILDFHQIQLAGLENLEKEVSPGVFCLRQVRPIEKIGLYVPGGTAPLPSTVLMLGIPALLAGCAQKILCTPPQKDGQVHPAILVAAQEVGISEIYKLGGAQAIVAMAYGTQTIPKCEKIFGPGNAWVTLAKNLVAQDPEGAALDMPAGPSEVLVIADQTARAQFVASDLLSQAEHGTDSQVILLSDSKDVLEKITKEIESQLSALSRSEIAREALSKSVFLLVDDLTQAMEISNRYAPEHLILQIQNPREWISKIKNAGSVFLGLWTPESVGDYASGTNHVLPTYGYARAWSGLSVESFVKKITFQELTPAGLKDLGPTVEVLARLEGLTAHERAVSFRLDALLSEDSR